MIPESGSRLAEKIMRKNKGTSEMTEVIAL
jgi:hypothetical protein